MLPKALSHILSKVKSQFYVVIIIKGDINIGRCALGIQITKKLKIIFYLGL